MNNSFSMSFQKNPTNKNLLFHPSLLDVKISDQ